MEEQNWKIRTSSVKRINCLLEQFLTQLLITIFYLWCQYEILLLLIANF